MDVFTRRDDLRSEPDHLPVAPHRAARRDLAQGNFVPAWDELPHAHLVPAAEVEDAPYLQIDLGNGNIVVWMQADSHVVERHDTRTRHTHKIDISNGHGTFLSAVYQNVAGYFT